MAEMQLLNVNGPLWRCFAGKLFTHTCLCHQAV